MKGTWSNCPKKRQVDSTRIVVKLVVESVGRWVGMKDERGVQANECVVEAGS